MNDRKPMATLDKLPEAAQQAIYAHCETVTLKVGSQWLLTEHRIKLSVPQLGKWLTKMRIDRNLQRLLSTLRNNSEQGAAVIKAGQTGNQVTSATETLLQSALFRKLITNPEDTKAITRLSKLLNSAKYRLKS